MGNIISQEARKRQAIVKYALKKGSVKSIDVNHLSIEIQINI